MNVTDDVAKIILGKAARAPGTIWGKIEPATKLYVRGYAQNLVDIAQGVKDGDITPEEAKLNVENAGALLDMAVANMAHVTLYEVQKFFDDVLTLVRSTVNAKLPIPVL